MEFSLKTAAQDRPHVPSTPLGRISLGGFRYFFEPAWFCCLWIARHHGSRRGAEARRWSGWLDSPLPRSPRACRRTALHFRVDAAAYRSVSFGLTYAPGRIVTTPVAVSGDIEESVMRHWALSAATGVAILISSSGSASPVRGPVSGNYILDRERSDDVVQAITSAVAGLSGDIRLPFARKLRKAAAPAYAIRLSIAAGRISIKNDAKPLIVVWTSGEPIKWKLEDGQVFDVSGKANGEAVSLIFHAADSERTTVYRSDGQQLVTETSIVSPLLSAPIRYKVVYNRAS